MTPSLFVDLALNPALRLLPTKMDTPAARAMLIAMALQESRLKHRRQIQGPARGYWQFEQGGGVKGVLTHTASKEYAQFVCLSLDYKPESSVVYEAIEHNDVLACVFARLLLWTLTPPLPARNNPAGGWSQYLSAWRPSKPHRDTWDDFYEAAWEAA